MPSTLNISTEQVSRWKSLWGYNQQILVNWVNNQTASMS